MPHRNNPQNNLGVVIIVSIITTIITIFVLMGVLYLLNFRSILEYQQNQNLASTPNPQTHDQEVSSQIPLETESSTEEKLEESESTTEVIEEKPLIPSLSYNFKNLPIEVKLNYDDFDYQASELINMAQKCEREMSQAEAEKILKTFQESQKIVYTFTHTESPEANNTFKLTALGNLANYQDLAEFKADFDQCFDGGDAYPILVNDQWLIFEGSCPSALSNSTENPSGCQIIKTELDKSLKLK